MERRLAAILASDVVGYLSVRHVLNRGLADVLIREHGQMPAEKFQPPENSLWIVTVRRRTPPAIPSAPASMANSNRRHACLTAERQQSVKV